MRVLIVLKKLRVDLMQVLRPRVVVPVRLGERSIQPDVVASVTTFVLLFGLIFIIGGLLLSASGMDLVSAFSASGACLTNLGPGFADVGPAQNYATLGAGSKLLLSALMVVGRLEVYTVLVLLFAARWK